LQSAATRNLDAAVHNLVKSQERFKRTQKPRDVGDLARLLLGADKLGTITAEIAKRRRAAARRQTALGQTIVGLGVATGSAGALRELTIPDEKTVTRHAERLAGIDQDTTAARETMLRLDAEIAELARNVENLESGGEVATEEDLETVRQARDAAWMIVRG